MGSVFVNLPNRESLSVTSQTNIFWHFHGHLQTCGNSKKMYSLAHTFPAEVEQGDTAFLFQLSYCKQVSFLWFI